MKNPANKINKRAEKGFTLIELMITLAIITILATASVPKVQMWIARNRGKAAVSNIISDFAKAKAIGAYSMSESSNSSTIYEKYVLSRPTTAIMYRKSSYTIIQRPATKTGDWYDNNVGDHQNLKQVAMPLNVTIENLNTGATNDGVGTSPTLVFTSNGRVKQSNNLLVPLGAGLGNLGCGAEDSTLNGRRIFVAIMKSTVDEGDPPTDNGAALWYRIEIDSTGDYFICVKTGDNVSQSDFGDGANILEM